MMPDITKALLGTEEKLRDLTELFIEVLTGTGRQKCAAIPANASDFRPARTIGRARGRDQVGAGPRCCGPRARRCATRRSRTRRPPSSARHSILSGSEFLLPHRNANV